MSVNEKRESAIRKKEGKKVLAKRDKENKKALALQAKEEKKRRKLGLVVVTNVKFQSDIDREYEEILAAKKGKPTQKDDIDFSATAVEETAPEVEETAVVEEPVAEEVVEEPVEEVVEEPAVEEPVAEEVVEEPVAEEPVEEVAEETAVTEEPAVEEPVAEETVEEPVEEAVEENAEEVAEEPVEEVAKKAPAKKAPAKKAVAKKAPAKKAPAPKPVKKEEDDEKKERSRNYHIVLREDGKWQVKREKGARAIKLFNTQAEAIAFAKERAGQMEADFVIHKKDGKIRRQRYDKKEDEGQN